SVSNRRTIAVVGGWVTCTLLAVAWPSGQTKAATHASAWTLWCRYSGDRSYSCQRRAWVRTDAASSNTARNSARASRNGASGLGIEVMDAYTGQARPAQSLSGGETFLASLALALGLAEVVTSRAGGIRLDTLFIDEGFGSLDAETLDIAMTTLDALRQGGRIVGVISHVEAMKEQLPAQLTVVAGSHGPSVIQQDAVVPQTA
ncbi:MAG: hypothetical protein J0I97_15255, partial [Microbacterium sp.]|nr:hypothetical protein [Microbacterium sp.]